MKKNSLFEVNPILLRRAVELGDAPDLAEALAQSTAAYDFLRRYRDPDGTVTIQERQADGSMRMVKVMLYGRADQS